MQNKVKGFGFRGWMLMIYQFMAYLANGLLHQLAHERFG